MRSAASDPRIRVCVAWGAFVDMSDWDKMPPRRRDGFVYLTGMRSQPQAAAFLQEALNIGDLIGSIRCPSYILQGGHDRIFSKYQTGLLAAAMEENGHCQLFVEPDGDHCCHNLANVVRPRMADWLSTTLLR